MIHRFIQPIRHLFHSKPTVSVNAVRGLYHAVAVLARSPGFYQAPHQVPDTLDGRFDLLATLVGLICLRVSALPQGQGQKASQALFDTMFHQFELNLREAGVGDLSVPKQMRRLIQSFYGRLAQYAEALNGTQTDTDLAQALNRNIYHDQDLAGATALAQWVTGVWQPLLQNFNSVYDINVLTRNVQVLSENVNRAGSRINDNVAA